MPEESIVVAHKRGTFTEMKRSAVLRGRIIGSDTAVPPQPFPF